MADQSVLVIGLDPDRVDFSGGQYGKAATAGGAMVKAALADSRRTLEQHGYQVDLCMVVLDDTAADAVQDRLDQRGYDYIVFGAGIRLNAANTDLFTRLINLAQVSGRGATFCFNAGAGDTADCVMRVATNSRADRLSKGSRSA